MKEDTKILIKSILFCVGIPLVCFGVLSAYTISLLDTCITATNFLNDKSLSVMLCTIYWSVEMILLGITLLGMVLMSMLNATWDIRKRLNKPNEDLQP